MSSNVQSKSCGLFYLLLTTTLQIDIIIIFILQVKELRIERVCDLLRSTGTWSSLCSGTVLHKEEDIDFCFQIMMETQGLDLPSYLNK